MSANWRDAAACTRSWEPDPMAEPVLQALVEAAVSGTGGADGWLLVRRAEQLEAVAAFGAHAGDILGARVAPDAGTAGFVLASGQPMALATRPDDPRLSSGVMATIGHPPSTVMCFPCESGNGVVGMLEIVDKADGAMFSFDDVELATLLAGIAGVAIETSASESRAAPTPDELATELRRL